MSTISLGKWYPDWVPTALQTKTWNWGGDGRGWEGMGGDGRGWEGMGGQQVGEGDWAATLLALCHMLRTQYMFSKPMFCVQVQQYGSE